MRIAQREKKKLDVGESLSGMLAVFLSIACFLVVMGLLVFAIRLFM